MTKLIILFLLMTTSLLCHIDDEIGYLSKDTIKYIESMNKKLIKKTGGEVAIVTRKSIGDDKPIFYAVDYIRSHEFGDIDKDNSILILHIEDKRWVQVIVGYDVEKVYSDSKIDKNITKIILESFKRDKFNQGVIDGFDGSFKLIKEME